MHIFSVFLYVYVLRVLKALFYAYFRKLGLKVEYSPVYFAPPCRTVKSTNSTGCTFALNKRRQVNQSTLFCANPTRRNNISEQQCGSQLDAHARHSFICKRAPGRTIRHHHLNELIARALSAASIPNTNEPQGLCRSDGKRPDGLTLVPRQSGKPLIWDVTVVCPLAESYVALATREPTATVEMAASNKTAKYAGLTTDYHFQPITVESLGPANESAVDFLTTLWNKIAQQTGDERETAFLF